MMRVTKMLPVFSGWLLVLWLLNKGRQRTRRKKLYVRIGDNGMVKIGTCMHCVVYEKGRPKRAWNPVGDAELDFERDALVQQLAEFGIGVEIEQEYVCP